MPTLHDDLRHAIQLRRWAWAALTDRPAPPPPASPRAWQLFLDREACAVALARVSGLELPEPVRQRAATETQHLLGARTELHAVAAIVSAIGLSVIPLKGTADLLGPQGGLPLKDLDLLVAPGRDGPVLGALSASGRTLQKSPTALESQVGTPGEVPIEIHRALWAEAGCPPAALWERARPHFGVAGIHDLDPADHLWLVLVHTALVHPTRSGRLRDRLLIRYAATPAASADVQRRISTHPRATILDAELRAALGDGRDELAVDQIAAVWYVLDARFSRMPLPRRARLHCLAWASFWSTPRDRRTSVWHRLTDVERSAMPKLLAAIDHGVPVLGRFLDVLIRLAWRLPFSAVGYLLARTAEATVRRGLRPA